MNNFYLKYKSPIAAILVLIILSGIFSITVIKTGLFPDITFPKIKIIAENGEQPVDKMMITVTVPMENAIKRVEELKFIRSVTSRGSCEISAFLNWGSDVDLGKQRVEAQINAVKQDLPPELSVTIEKMNPSILPVMGFSLEGEGRSPIELRQIAEFTIKPILSRIEGISEVAVIGGKVKEYHVVMDPMKMSNLRITPALLSNVLSQSNFITSNGFLSEYNRLYLALTDAAIDEKNELENTVIVNSLKGKIRLKDIAKVEIVERRTCSTALRLPGRKFDSNQRSRSWPNISWPLAIFNCRCKRKLKVSSSAIFSKKTRWSTSECWRTSGAHLPTT